MSERSERLAASEASLAEKVMRSTTNQLVFNMTKFLPISFIDSFDMSQMACFVSTS